MDTHLKIGRSAASLLLAAAVAATLVACTPPAPTPSASPAPAASPAPTPTASVGVAAALSPQPIIDLTCAELLADSTVAAQFAVPVVPADAAISMMTAARIGMGAGYVVRSLGGLACEWNNGESYSSYRGYNPAYVGYRVVVLPDAASQWANYLRSRPEGAGQFCGSISPDGLSCSSNDLVSDLWVEIKTYGVISDVAAAALRTSVIDGVSAAAPVAQVWLPPAGTLPLPTDCGGLVPYSTVTSALGSSVPLVGFRDGVGGNPSLWSGANVNAGVGGCGWYYPDTDYGFGEISTLAGGGWAWDEARPALTTPAVPEPLVIAGLSAADQAWIRCAPANAECVVDLVIGGNWIAFHLWPDGGLGFVTADTRAAATAIAEGVVATLRS